MNFELITVLTPVSSVILFTAFTIIWCCSRPEKQEPEIETTQTFSEDKDKTD